MELCNTNRLRVSVNSARKYAISNGITRYHSDDHGRGREFNWSIGIGPLWLMVKWRPNGKRSSEDSHG